MNFIQNIVYKQFKDNSSIVIEDITIYGFTSPIFSQTHITRNYLNDYNQLIRKNI